MFPTRTSQPRTSPDDSKPFRCVANKPGVCGAVQNIAVADVIQLIDVAWTSMEPLSGLRCPSQSYVLLSSSFLSLAGLENVVPANAPGPNMYIRFNPLVSGIPISPLSQMAKCSGSSSPLSNGIQFYIDNCPRPATTYSQLCAAIANVCP